MTKSLRIRDEIAAWALLLLRPSTVQFVDDVRVEPSAVRAEGSLYVDPAADYLRDHFPGTPMLPGLLMLETCVRTATALWRARPRGDAADRASLVRVDRLQVVRRVVPGETFIARVEMSGDDQGGRAQFVAQGEAGGEIAMRARFELVIRPSGQRLETTGSYERDNDDASADRGARGAGTGRGAGRQP